MTTIITNNQPREMVALWQLPESAQADFDYITGEDRYSDRLVQYKGSWYDVSDGERGWGSSTMPPEFHGWDNYITDSFFSGILWRYALDENGHEDFDRIIMGRYYA